MPVQSVNNASYREQRLPDAGQFDYNRIQGIRNNPNVTPEFLRGVEAMAGRLGTRPEYLLAVMSFETGGSFSPGVRNGAGSGATGLIQFMPDTAAGLGTSTQALSRMSATEQLQFVERYFDQRSNAGDLSTLEGVYTTVLHGSPKTDPASTLFASGTAAYRMNAPLDVNGDGRITSGEATSFVRNKIDGPLPNGPANGGSSGSTTGTSGGTGASSGTQQTGSGGAGGDYNIKWGDTLSELARNFGTSVRALMDANPKIKDPDLIYAGDTLRVPGGGSGNGNGTSGTQGTSGTTGTSGTSGTSGTQGTSGTASVTGNEVADLAASFLGRNASELKRSGDLPMNPNVPNNVCCANFVSAVLQKAGLLNQHTDLVSGSSKTGMGNPASIGAILKKQGWEVVPASQARPGDVAIVNNGGHVELVHSNDNGKIKLIGSNNVNPDGSQRISFGNPFGNAWYLSPPR